MNEKLSVIIPFCNEYPQVLFTLQNIAQELRGRVDFEVIAVDNYCEQVKSLGYENDKSGEAVNACSGRINPWLKYLKYEKKLSHWQSKNLGVKHSTGDFLWFCDAHCIISRDSLFNMFQFYKENHRELNGTLHLPLTYKILESHILIYKLVNNLSKGHLDYSFTGYRRNESPYEVPCMSCCGVMMSREVYNKLGGWPPELGIYSGGEQFLNFSLAVMGMKKWIFPTEPLFHHGEKRGYCYVYDDYLRNKLIATYCYGGEDLCRLFSENMKGKPEALKNIYQDVIAKCQPHRKHIANQQKISIQEWARKWKGEDG